jgi:type IV pilus assembly protein PilV
MRQPTFRRLLSARRAARGFTLIDSLIALAILTFGLLAMTRLQARALAQATESQARMTAVQFGDELISTILIDAANHDCYRLPAGGTCGSNAAKALTTDWNTRLTAALRGGAATSSYDNATGRMTVSITWTNKDSGSTNQLNATTDVRQ